MRTIKCLQAHPQTSQIYIYCGTTTVAQMANPFGGLTIHNLSAGSFEDAERTNAKTPSVI